MSDHSRERDSGDRDSLLSSGKGNSPYGIQDASESGSSGGKSMLGSIIHSKERIWAVAFNVIIACIGSLLVGVMLGYSSETIVELVDIYKHDKTHGFKDSGHANLFGGFGAMGALFGGPFAFPVSDWLGRKPAIMLGGVPALIGWLMITYAHLLSTRVGFLAVLYIGRLFTGFSGGWFIFTVSVYIAEISSPKLKGLFGACNQLFVTIGIFYAYVLGTIADHSSTYEYFHVSLTTVGVVALFVLLMLFTSESPRWLYANSRELEGQRVLNFLRGPGADVQKEIRGIQKALERQEDLSFLDGIKEFTHRSVLQPFILVLMLMFFQQFSGINAAIFYAASIFSDAGIKNASLISAFAIGGVQIIATLVSVMLIDRLGRKKLLIISSIGMCISSTLLGVEFLISKSICGGNNATVHVDHAAVCNHNIGWLAILGAILFIVFFSLAWGPIPWLMMSELLPLRVRSLAASITTFFNWSLATLVTFEFQDYAKALSPKFAWWSFAVVMFVSVFFIFLFLPETKGHSLEEIEDYFKQGHLFSPKFSLRIDHEERREPDS